jgi:hypothetical protein
MNARFWGSLVVAIGVSSAASAQNNWVAFDQTGRHDIEITNLISSTEKVEYTITFHGLYLFDSLIGNTIFHRIYIL